VPVPRLLQWLLRLTAVALTLALAALVALIAGSADNSPYMTPFAAGVIGLASVLVLLGYVGDLVGMEDDNTAEPPVG
jgi:hypothetical protein